MQEHVGEHAQSTVARRVVVLVPKDRSVDLSLGRILQPFDLFLRLGGDIDLQRLNIFLDAVDQAHFAVLAVRDIFVSHDCLETFELTQ